ncbi:MAG: V-type ATP synthase subunit E [Thermodesulfovibrionia bacterium]|nr:V-type ATP synthase subunit E [Thermodesulfovibrionia bacterium]MCK5511183.1 V-type ATP synthase subunit E [Thermodesulfovibrionia bacterium]
MGYRELIDGLRKEGERKSSKLWSEAQAEAEKIRAETYRNIEEMREKYRKSQERAITEQEEAILSEAKERARIIRLSAEKDLSDRLFQVALSLLHQLRNERYEDMLTSLVTELPDTEWDKIRVNPEDVRRARVHFPDSDIIPDAAIHGGLEASKGDGKIHVINTFQKRLERAWEDLQPLIMGDIYKEMRRHGIPSEV